MSDFKNGLLELLYIAKSTAYSSVAITFTNDWVDDDKLALNSSEFTQSLLWTWVTTRSTTREVTSGTPTGTAGETSAINFGAAFLLDYPTGYTISVTDNVLTITSTTLGEDFNNVGSFSGTGTLTVTYNNSADVYFPIGCLLSNGFSEGVDMLETTTRVNTNGWKTSVPTSQSYNISANGLVTTSNKSGSIITYEDLMNLKRAKTKISWKINSETPGYSDFGTGYIVSLSRTAEINSFIEFSVEITGYGQPQRLLDIEADYLNYTLNTDI